MNLCRFSEIFSNPHSENSIVFQYGLLDVLSNFTPTTNFKKPPINTSECLKLISDASEKDYTHIHLIMRKILFIRNTLTHPTSEPTLNFLGELVLLPICIKNINDAFEKYSNHLETIMMLFKYYSVLLISEVMTNTNKYPKQELPIFVNCIVELYHMFPDIKSIRQYVPECKLLNPDSQIFIPSNISEIIHQPPQIPVVKRPGYLIWRGIFKQLKITNREWAKKRTYMVLTGKFRGTEVELVRWNGSNVDVRYNNQISTIGDTNWVDLYYHPDDPPIGETPL